MSTCKDCIHYDICINRIRYHADENEFTGKEFTDIDKACKRFKDCSKFIELPCKVGDVVYICTYFGMWYAPHEIDKCEMTVTRITIVNNTVVFEAMKDKYNADTFIQRQIGNTVFLTKEEAEKALAERGVDNV